MTFQECIYCTFFEFNTVKYVSINCKILGLVNRFFCLCIGVYIVGYVLLYKKGYQEFDEVESAITTKVKGVTLTNYSKEEFQIPESNIPLYNRLWDVSEYVVPASENEAFFIMTNAVITPNQTFQSCDEDPDVKGALCGDGLPPCKPGFTYQLGNGVATGNCINSTQNPRVKVCEVEAWCPTEFDIFPLKDQKALLEDSKYYTVLIKNRIYFPKFGSKYIRSNILVDTDLAYLKTCRYNEEDNPFCPIFQIKNIVEGAGQNFSEVAIKGAVISIQIVWNCDLDFDFMKNCHPKYSFHRLDNANANLTLGWNFRHSYHHEFGRRTLVKVYGIKFVLDVQGQAGRFNLVPTLTNIGAGLGLMGLVQVLSDLIMLTFLKSRKNVRKHKYMELKGDYPFLVKNMEYESIETVI